MRGQVGSGILEVMSYFSRVNLLSLLVEMCLVINTNIFCQLDKFDNNLY